jgi:hypothetical protein
MPTQYAIPAAFALGFYIRGRLAAAGRTVDAIIADDPWDVPFGDEEIYDHERRGL